MKKNILIMLILLYMIIFLSSCNNINQPNNSGMLGESIQQPTEEDRLSNDADNFKDDALEAPNKLYIEDYREYRRYIKSNAVPQQFVSFQKINFEKKLNFDWFRLADSSGKYAYYDYAMCMSNGEKISLRVNHAGYHDTLFSDKPVIERPNLMEDMRDMPINELAVIYIDDIQYVYLFNHEGMATLYSVTFVIDEIQFRWTFNDANEFPNEKDTFIEGLLHASTATQARDEFAAAIRGGQPSQLGWRILFVATPIVVVGGMVVFFVIRKKKVKAKENV